MSSRLGIRSKPDDSESVADSLAFLLDCYVHHADVAYDVETAPRLLRAGAFEITFLDENLPDIKGSAVAWSLRETPIRSAAFLVSMTTDALSICRSRSPARHSCRSSKTLAAAAMRILAKPPRPTVVDGSAHNP
jgi:CheY-like chemotaxis protein